MMKKIILSVLMIAVILSSRSAAAEYKRIVSLAPAITEIVYAFGMDKQLVGVTDYCDYPEEARQKESVGGFINPSLEKIIALDPDIVVVSKNGGLKGIARKLDEFAIPIKIVSFYSLTDLYEAFRAVAALGDIPERGEEEVRRFDEKIEACRATLESVPPRKVLFIRWRDPLSVAANGSLEDEIITITGGTNIVTGSKTRYPAYTAEAIALAQPDVIIDASYYNTPTEAERKEIARFWQKFGHLEAVKNDNVFIIKTDLHSVPGPRTVQFIDEMAHILHPEKFTTTWGLSERIDV
jgi:iron complex transport system substrate-binding protein